MLTIQETLWQLLRNKGRSLILVLASAMIVGCMAFYMANITANEEAIERLATDIPVAVWVTNPGGDRNWGLNINENRKEKFFSSPYLRDAGTGIRVVGELSEEAQANSPFAKESSGKKSIEK